MDEAEVEQAFVDIVAELALDDVIEKLAAVGVQVEPWQRPLLWAWLSGSGSDTSVPLPLRLARLRRVLDRTKGVPRCLPR